jgi:hypothetical protein
MRLCHDQAQQDRMQDSCFEIYNLPMNVYNNMGSKRCISRLLYK